MVDGATDRVNGQHLDNEALRLAELAIMTDPPAPLLPEEVTRLFAAKPEAERNANRIPCRGGACSDGDFCDNCSANWKYLRLELHRLDHGRYVHPAPDYCPCGSGWTKGNCESCKAPPPRTGAQIILDYLRERWQPVFRRGTTIHCRDGEELTQQIACVPDSVIIGRLAGAVDSPKDKHGVNPDALPGFFRKWAPVAWGDLRGEVPEEIHAQLGDDAPARETFVRLVSEAMFSQHTFGDVIGRQGIVQTERRSLIGWAVKFAKLGPWRDIRSLACWCRLTEPTAGEIVLHIAIRHELFAQVGADRWLRNLGATKFARLAMKYGIGTSTEKDRPHGKRAIVLASDLVTDLTSGVPDDAENLPVASNDDLPPEVPASNFDPTNIGSNDGIPL